jgi:hypothetical protein
MQANGSTAMKLYYENSHPYRDGDMEWLQVKLQPSFFTPGKKDIVRNRAGPYQPAY